MSTQQLYGLICLFIIMPALFLTVRHLATKIKIKAWQRALNVPEHRAVFENLYHDVNGFKLSQQARLKGDAFEYAYGEIEFEPFIALLSLAKTNADTVFYDLGSGTGKAVLAAAMVFPIKKSVGIELFTELHSCAWSQTNKLAKIPSYSQVAKKIEFIHNVV